MAAVPTRAELATADATIRWVAPVALAAVNPGICAASALAVEVRAAIAAPAPAPATTRVRRPTLRPRSASTPSTQSASDERRPQVRQSTASS